MFASGTGFWGVGASLAQPIVDGGVLLPKERAAKAAYVQAAEQYRSTVLTAFENVAATPWRPSTRTPGPCRRTPRPPTPPRSPSTCPNGSGKDGYASYLTLLSAEQAYQQARISLVQAQANRFADTVALFQALGGGWWRRTELARDDHAH